MNCRRYAMAAILILCTAANHAQAQEVPAAERFRPQIDGAKRYAEEGREAIGIIAFNAKEAGDIATADVVEAKKWMDRYIAHFDKAAALFEKGDQQAGWKALDEGHRLIQGRERWKDRVQARQEQAKSAPTEQWAARERRDAPIEAAAAIDRYIEATNAISEAWGAYADIMRPGVTDVTMVEARQRINVAQVNRDIAAWRLNWTRENRELYALRGKSPKLDAQLDAIEKRQAEIEQTRLARVKLDGQQESAEVARRELIGQAREFAAPMLQKLREDEWRAKQQQQK